jgi:N-acyl amino acid synthase of PEP-CTERM/exosortase system
MFDQHYEVLLADTPESKAIHYSIRYKVYCEEMGFENKDNFHQKQEIDNYDQHSVHFIVRTKTKKKWVGALRIIYKNDNSLPIENFCILKEPIVKNNSKQSAEISRLCILKEARTRYIDIDPTNGIKEKKMPIRESNKINLTHNKQQLINRSIMWGLLNAATEYCYSNNIRDWYFMTTIPLAKVLRKGGFNMINFGEGVHHNGNRYPFKKDVIDTYHNEAWRKHLKKGFSKFSELNLQRSTTNIA